ncbi:MAG: hypothetical protein EOM80_16025, partial [Erysipelotrichia bacterium]|nr:hypothetical protein [Erysipelotrichia bacterium]
MNPASWSYESRTKVIGLDVGLHSMKAVLLERQGASLTCLGAIECPFSAGEERTTEEYKDALRQVASAFGSKTKAAAIVAQDTEVQLKFLDKPLMTLEQLDLVMDLEFKQVLSQFETGSALAAYTLLGQTINDEASTMHVLMATFQRSWLESQEKIFKEVGLQLVGIYPFPMALRDCYWANYKELLQERGQPYLVSLLNLGSRSNQVVVCDLLTIRLARAFPFAGDELTQSLVKAYTVGENNIMLDQTLAEQYKQAIGILSPEEITGYADRALEVQVSEMIRRGVDRMMQKIRLSLDYFKGQMKAQVSQVLAFGGGANLRGLEDALREQLTVDEITLMFPFAKIDFKPLQGFDPDPALAPKLVGAVGAAVCGMRPDTQTLNLTGWLKAVAVKRMQNLFKFVVLPILMVVSSLIAPTIYYLALYNP